MNSAIFAGGGMKVGQVIGSTDRLGAYTASSPIHYHDVLATIYNRLGIDHHEFIYDRTNRPVSPLPATAQPIAALVG